MCARTSRHLRAFVSSTRQSEGESKGKSQGESGGQTAAGYEAESVSGLSSSVVLSRRSLTRVDNGRAHGGHVVKLMELKDEPIKIVGRDWPWVGLTRSKEKE